MSRLAALARTVGQKRKGWVKRGLHRLPPEHARLLAGYDVCTTIVETPAGIFGAVSLLDGSTHKTSALAKEWDAAVKTLSKKAVA